MVRASRKIFPLGQDVSVIMAAAAAGVFVVDVNFGVRDVKCDRGYSDLSKIVFVGIRIAREFRG